MVNNSYQKIFARKFTEKVKELPEAIGLAVGGSWISDEIDEYSDLDFILITENRINDSREKMIETAAKLGKLINAFTGEHVGEPRLLICMYDNPLIHVDIKFLTLEEFRDRVEEPVVLWEKDNALTNVINETEASWPEVDCQWIEDRFWAWIHYAALKVGRGEIFEAIDFISAIRQMVIAPLMQIRNGQLPRGLRKVETNFLEDDLENLKETIAAYDNYSIISAIDTVIYIYRFLREELFPEDILGRELVEERVIGYWNKIKMQKCDNTDEALKINGFRNKKFDLSVAINSLKIFFNNNPKSEYIWIDPPWVLAKGDEVITTYMEHPDSSSPRYNILFKKWLENFRGLRDSEFIDYKYENPVLYLNFSNGYRLIIDSGDCNVKPGWWYFHWYVRTEG